MKFWIISGIAVLGLLGLFFATQKSNTPTTSAPSLTFQTVQGDVSKGAHLIDVRTPEEYAAGHIDGAINLSLQDIQAGKMPSATKDQKLYLYCHSGNRAAQAETILKAAGYQSVVNLGAMTHVESIGGVIKK